MNVVEVLRRLRDTRPLVHHITNYVTVNLVANTTLCMGALPVMAHALEEVEEMENLASALCLNIGTLDPNQIEAMLAAGRRANERGIPIVLDPVGAGATSLRTETAARLLRELDVAVVCGNAGEIATLAGHAAEVRGVESLSGDAESAVRSAASSLGVTAAATGLTDHVSDGETSLTVSNGHPLMGRVVGTGCASTAVVACFAAAGGGDAETVAAALGFFGRAGEVAAEGFEGGPGTYERHLLDAVARLAARPSLLEGGIVVA